jgi:hypothetical protein
VAFQTVSDQNRLHFAVKERGRVLRIDRAGLGAASDRATDKEQERRKIDSTVIPHETLDPYSSHPERASILTAAKTEGNHWLSGRKVTRMNLVQTLDLKRLDESPV